MKRLLLLLFVGFVIQNTDAQVKVLPANQSGSATQGIYYALPKTAFKVNVSISHKQVIPGPFSDYAEKYLGIMDAPKVRSDSYEILGINMESFTRPDPEQVYFGVYGEKANKDEKSLNIQLSEAGLILGTSDRSASGDANAIELNNNNSSDIQKDHFNNFVTDNLYEDIDTVIRRINIDTLTIEKNFYRSTWRQKSSEQKAKDAADFISRIKENRFLLMSGYQEVNYGESIKYMDRELQKLYNEYLSLFIGVKESRVMHYSFIYIPESTSAGESVPLFRFSSSRGFFKVADGIGDNVFIKLDPSGLADKIRTVATGKPSPSSEYNGFYYRIPEYANVVIDLNGKKLYEANLPVSQFGVVSTTPFYDPSVQFHQNTGGIKSLRIR